MKFKLDNNHTLTFNLIAFVTLILTLTGLIGTICYAVMHELNPELFKRFAPLILQTSYALFCLFIGVIVTVIFSRYFLKPMNALVDANKEIGKGNFSVRLQSDESLVGEMVELISSFNKMAEELGGIEMFRSDFINNFSHELKTPVASINGFAKQLQDDENLTDEQREYLRIIAEESGRLVKLSSNILLLSKLDSQQIVTGKSRFYLDEQIRNSIILLEKQWTEKNIVLDIDMDALSFYANEEMLSHIWINLLSNAIKFTPEHGKIAVRAGASENGVTVSVEDSGNGIDEKDIQHIFDRFFQGDKSRSNQGSGLGLALVKRTVELCGGEIKVRSEKGKGTKFTVNLPN